MTWWQYALWGAFGGLAVEMTQFLAAVQRTGGWPWEGEGEPGAGPYAASVVVRVGLGLGLAAAAAESDQISGPFGAIAIGIAAPLVVEQLARMKLQSQTIADLQAAPAEPPAEATGEVGA